MYRHIGIVMGKVHTDINRQLLRGILDEAYMRGVSAHVFTLTDEYDKMELNAAKNLLHSALRRFLFEGILFLPYTFSNQEFQVDIRHFLQEHCRLPVVCIGTEKEFQSVWFQDRAEVAEITSHLISVHGCRRLICLTGPTSQQVSHERLAGFLDAMASARLPVGDEAIIFGDFWVYTARELAQEIASGIRPKPDAVVCTNDTMALSLCDALAELNCPVPDEILVTGYDGTIETELHVPTVTTYRTSWRQLGRNAFCILYNQMTGSSVTARLHERGLLLCRESCGCQSVVSFEKNRALYERRLEAQDLDVNLTSRLLACSDLDDLVQTMYNCTFIFSEPELDEYMQYRLCLYQDWESGSAKNTKMLEMDYNGVHVPFSADEMVPPDLQRLPEPSVTFFTAVRFQERCFGYAMLRLSGKADGFNSHYLRFCREIGNALEFLRLRNLLERQKTGLPEDVTASYADTDQLHYADLLALRKRIFQFPEQNWSLTVCSEQLSISKSYFHKIYLNTFGSSCVSDIRRSKLEYAKRLLVSSSDTLQEVARKCGYDYSHFMRMFRQEFHMTPTQFRRNQKK